MQRIMSIGAALFFGLSLVALTIGVAQGYGAAFGRQTQGLRFQEAIKMIGDVNAGENGEVIITVENLTNRAITILGGSRACYPYCCLTFEGAPQRVPAYAHGTVRYRLVAGRHAGEFQVPVTLFTDCDGQPELTIEVKGRLIAKAPALASGPR